MKKQLLWSTAALLATIGLASAQGAQGDSVGGKASAAGKASSTVSGSSQGSQARPDHAKREQAQGEGRNHEQGPSEKNRGQGQAKQSKGHGQAQPNNGGQTSGEARDNSHEGKAKINQAEDRNQGPKKKDETTGQAVGKNNQGKERSEAEKRGNKNQAETRDHRPQHDQTTGQGGHQQGEAAKQGSQTSQSQPSQPSQPGGGKSGQPARSAAEAQPGGGARAHVQGASLIAEQQTKIQQTMLSSSNVHRVDRVGFSVSVGTAVPRSVSLVDVPPAVVDIYPQWRGNSYVVVRDEIVIVDHSRKIVAVIPAGSSGLISTVVLPEVVSPVQAQQTLVGTTSARFRLCSSREGSWRARLTGFTVRARGRR